MLLGFLMVGLVAGWWVGWLVVVWSVYNILRYFVIWNIIPTALHLLLGA